MAAEDKACDVTFSGNTIKFSMNIIQESVHHFMEAVQEAENGSSETIHLDFSAVESVYSIEMLPIIAVCKGLQRRGYDTSITLPFNDYYFGIFINQNWAHWIMPSKFESSNNAQTSSIIFTNSDEQQECVGRFVRTILKQMNLEHRSSISGLEWVMNEITDNVLNHSNSPVGGIFQANAFPAKSLVTFTVADIGRGILSSLKEGYPNLRNDAEAIGEAIKAGVTRGRQHGQGNGLAGTIRITTLSQGSAEIWSGRSRVIILPSQTRTINVGPNSAYQGTIVSGSIRTDVGFSLSEALSFPGNPLYISHDIIDSQFEHPDQDVLQVKMSDEATGFGNRNVGRQLRQLVLNLLRSKPDYPVVIDWEGVPLISSSFADEFMGRLFLELGPLSFSARVRNRGMEPLIRGLLDKAIAQRLTQELDE